MLNVIKQFKNAYFVRYDHGNYSRWGTINLAEMKQLPSEVEAEFRKGNFVVNRATQKFNMVDPDQSQEWLNGTGKRGGGIVGITKTPSALSRWALSYNLRVHISATTRKLFNLEFDEEIGHPEGSKSRQRQYAEQEAALKEAFEGYGVFGTNACSSLQSITTKDLATTEIESSLLNARTFGQKQLEEFVEKRLMLAAQSTPQSHFMFPFLRIMH